MPIDRNVELLIKDPRMDPVPPPPPPVVRKAKITKVRIAPRKKNIRAGKRTRLTVKVTNWGTAPKKNAKLRLKSSNKRVKVPKKIKIRKIAPKSTKKIKITVRARGRARGKAKITAKVSGKKGRAKVKVKSRKKKNRKNKTRR